MSHQQCAAVWSVLQSRSDIDHILRELVGRYAFEVAIYRNDSLRVRNTSFLYVVSLKAIFDLQRTYLQSSDPSFESKTYLVQHDLLFQAVIHLLEVKTESFGPHKELVDHKPYCGFLAQTLLSGLRALLLHKRSLMAEEHEMLTRRFNEVWREEQLDDVHHFVVQMLCRQIILELGMPAQDSKYTQPACGLVNLPDFAHKLVRLQRLERSRPNPRCSMMWEMTKIP